MGHRYLIVLSMFLMFSCSKKNEQLTTRKNTPDVLANYFEIANNDSVPFATRRYYNEKALRIVSKQPNDLANRQNYFLVAGRYYNIGLLEEYRDITNLIIRNSKTAYDTVSLAKAYSYTFDYFQKVNQPDSMYHYNYEAEKLYLILDDKVNLVQTLLNKAVLQHNYSDFLGCEKTAIQMLRILKNYNDIQMEYEANNLLGIVYGKLEDFDLSKQYYDKAIELANDKSIPSNYQYRAVTINNLGSMYSTQKNYSQAKEQFLKGLIEKNLIKDRPDLYAMLNDNLGHTNLKLRDFSEIPDLFYKALKMRQDSNLISGIIISKIHLSEFYASQNDNLKAITMAEEAYSLAVENKLTRDLLAVLRQLSDVDSKKARKYSAEYYKISDSLNVIERQTRNKFARIEYETDELVIEKTNLVEQRRTLIYIALGIILIGVFVFVIRSQAAKNRELRLLREQQAANEEIYRLMISQQQQRDEGRQLEKKRIARELHDGVMGQLTAIRMNLFPLGRKQDPETIRECLPHIDKIREVEQEIRSIAYDLDSPLTDNADFTEVIHTIFTGLEQHSGIRFVLQADTSIDWQSVPVDTKVQLYRILQEALQNIVKYAKAGKVTVDISLRDSVLWMSVQDDGIGFDPKLARKGLGLRNMRQRAEDLGGTMTVHTAPGQGTSLEFLLPLNNGL